MPKVGAKIKPRRSRAFLYLREGIFVESSIVRFGHQSATPRSKGERSALCAIFESNLRPKELRDQVSTSLGISSRLAESRVQSVLADDRNVVGSLSLGLAARYDAIFVEQGYGGVYVNTYEVVKFLRRAGWKCLLLSPESPLFEPKSHRDDITLPSMQQGTPTLSYLSYVHILRSIIRFTEYNLLVLAHRSQSLFLFDLLDRSRTVIYCDGYYDTLFRIGRDLEPVNTTQERRRVLSEIFYLLGNSPHEFYGLLSNPGINLSLLRAGYGALDSTGENWCWGDRQTKFMKAAFPEAEARICFEPPFLNSDIFEPRRVKRRREVLFTTTMHNIDKKGFPELMSAASRLPGLRIRCVVRQPERLPPVPETVVRRMKIETLTKEEIVRLYHRVWLNCRTSRDESSPVSILESMICEVPQIVSPVVAEQIPIIRDGSTGFIVNPDDIAVLVARLRDLLEDESLRNEMGRASREAALGYAMSARRHRFERFFAGSHA